MSLKFNIKNGKIKNLGKCLSINMIFYIIFFGVGYYLGLIINKPNKALFTLAFCTLFSYLSHRVSHLYFPFNFKYFHQLHHNEKHNKKVWAEIIEWLVNIIQIGGLILIPINYFIEKYFKIQFLSNYLIIYYTLVYTSTHMINYHIMSIDTHIKHHLNTKTNFGPDYVDILFGTKYNGSTFEEMNETIINSLYSGIIVLFLIQKKIFK